MPTELTDDALLGGRLRYRQPRKGFRVTIDAPLLAFAALNEAGAVANGNLLDIGCGVGTCGIAFNLHRPDWHLTGVEIQPDLAELAAESARFSGLSGPHFIPADINDPATAPGPYDLILSNPPYFPAAGHQLSPHPGKNIARFEIHLTLQELQTAIAARLAPDGRALVIIPYERKNEFAAGPLTVLKSRPVLHCPGNEPGRAILTLAHPGTPPELPPDPLVIYADAEMKEYTLEFGRFLDGKLMAN